MMTKTKYGIMLMFLSATALLTGCGNDDYNENSNGNANANENAISFSTDLQPFAKASTFDSTTDMQTEGSFTCTTYEANTTTTHISASRVVWSGIDWQFADDIHFWPTSGDLDFFAYMPKSGSLPSYISSVTYPSARSAQLVCRDMPMTKAGQDGLKEFIWALSTGKNKSNSSAGVAMTFRHPFAKITFRVGNPASDGITINTVTLSALKTGGTCSFDGTTSTWSDQDGSTNLVGTADTPYIIIPYNYTSGLTITANATWSNIGNATADTKAVAVAANFQPGYSYIYTLTLDGTALKVDVDKYTVEQW